MNLSTPVQNKDRDRQAAFLIFLLCLLASFYQEAGDFFTAGITSLN